MYEHALEDIDRKFNQQVCCLQTDKLLKDFYYINRDGPEGYAIINKEGITVATNVPHNKMKFTYHRFMAGFYPTNSPYGYVCICRAPENKTYTQGLGRGSFRFSGDFSDSYDFFRSLRGTFTEPNWYKDIKLNGAYSRLYRRTGNRIYSCLGHVVANYDLKYSIIQLPPEPEQELIDLLKRTNNLGASSVNKG